MPGVRGLVVGLVLALALTVVPFGVVYFGLASGSRAAAIIAACAILQVPVHLRWFVFSQRAPDREEALALGFGALLLLIMVAGSLWIMTDLHHRMM